MGGSQASPSHRAGCQDPPQERDLQGEGLGADGPRRRALTTRDPTGRNGGAPGFRRCLARPGLCVHRQLDVLALSGSGSASLTRTRSPHDPRVGRRCGSHSDRSQVSVRCSPLPSGRCGGSGSGGAAWPPGQWPRTPDPRALTVSRHVRPFHSSVGGGLPPLLPGSWPPGPGASRPLPNRDHEAPPALPYTPPQPFTILPSREGVCSHSCWQSCS